LKVRFLTFALTIFYLLATSALASVLVYPLQIDSPDLLTGTDGLRITLTGSPSLGNPGEPLLPKTPVRLLLPPGESIVNVSVLALESEQLCDGLAPRVAQPPYALNDAPPNNRMTGLPSIYQGKDEWPADPLISWREDFYRGHRILTLLVSPLSYRGRDDRIIHHRNLEVRIETQVDASASAQMQLMLHSDDATRTRLSRLLFNPEMLESYERVSSDVGSSRSTPPLDYMILSTERWATQLETYIHFLRSRGHHVRLYLRSWVNENYAGRDEPEALRNFIQETYQETGMKYLLIVGDTRDDDGIPHRGFYCQSYSTTDYDLPGDIYYGALDGDWNLDGDGRWGEPGEGDLFPEVSVGRACVSDEDDLEQFMRKHMLYQEAPVLEHTTRMLMVGEKLWNNPLTWGANYKDEIWFGSDANGLVTEGVPPTMAVGSLYERTWAWEDEHLKYVLNDGMGIVNHQGHAYYNLAAKIHNNDLSSLSNDGIDHGYGFFYSQGCYCGSFDDKASYGGYHSDCFAERLTTEFGGAVATVMNSRYGWGDAGGTAGPSQFYDREFFDALFGEEVLEAGLANDDAKMDLAWMVDYPGMRWCHYNLNLFGDPALRLWTQTPASLEMTGMSGMSGNSEEVVLRVLSNGAPLPGAKVTLFSQELDIQISGTSNISGQATLSTSPLREGLYTLTIHRKNFVTHRSEHIVREGGGPGDEPADEDAQPRGSVPGLLSLGPNVPNPFNPSTTIQFELPFEGAVDLIIYDVEGRRVRTLLSASHLGAGHHCVIWDGRDHQGQEMGSGVYFSLLSSGDVSDTGKMLMLK
jgi:hypothetical protein